MRQCHGMGTGTVVAGCSTVYHDVFSVVRENLCSTPNPILWIAGAAFTCLIWSGQQVWFLVLLQVWWSSTRCNAPLCLVCLEEGSWICSGQCAGETTKFSGGSIASSFANLRFTQSQNVPGRSMRSTSQLQCGPVSDFSNARMLHSAVWEGSRG